MSRTGQISTRGTAAAAAAASEALRPTHGLVAARGQERSFSGAQILERAVGRCWLDAAGADAAAAAAVAGGGGKRCCHLRTQQERGGGGGRPL